MGRQPRTDGAQVYCTSSRGDRQREGPAPLPAQVIQRLVDAFDGDDVHALDALLGLVCRRDDGAMEAELGRFAQPLLSALYGPDFARQTNLAKHQRFTI